MSYYEWVQAIETLKDSPMDETQIKELENKKIEKNDYVLARLMMHIYITIEERLNHAGYLCLKSLLSKTDINEIELDFINFKKEKKYILKLMNLQILSNTQKENIKKRVNIKFKEIYDFLKQKINNIDAHGMYINTFEKIMSSNTEE